MKNRRLLLLILPLLFASILSSCELSVGGLSHPTSISEASSVTEISQEEISQEASQELSISEEISVEETTSEEEVVASEEISENVSEVVSEEVNENEVLITPSNCGLDVMSAASGFEFTVNGVKVEVSNGMIASDYNTQVTAFRVYKSNTLTISADKNISRVDITAVENGSKSSDAEGFVGSGYSAATTNGTWEGSSKQVVLTASNYQVRVLSIKVTFE